MREQRGNSPGVQKNDRFIGSDGAGAYVGDQAGHCFRGIRRIEQDAVPLGEQMDRFEAAARGDAVAGADVVLIRHELVGRH